MTTIAVIGLGEAGALYARGLRDAGCRVIGYDPFTTLSESGIDQRGVLVDAVDEAELVISLVGARAAASVAHEALQAMRSGAVFADFNTGSPALKKALGEESAAAGVLFADVAVLAPVPRAGHLTPLMVSGAGADAFSTLFAASEAPVLNIEGTPGDAAARKLIRSVFMKGLAALVIESTTAARAAGCETWLRDQIANEFAGDAPQLIQRLIDGSKQHAARRAHEVEDARDYLHELDTPGWVTDATRLWFGELLGENNAHGSAAHEGVSA